MPLFTRKRTYLGCERVRIDFKITVKHISFTTNQYFLANSHYVIFRKEQKSKQVQSKKKVPAAANLKMVPVDEKIKFRVCLVQDLAHRYLERYIHKERKFHIRQVTETKTDEMYVDCGYFKLPLDVYGMQESGQDIVVDFVDPSKMASGTVHLRIEHEPSVLVKFFPNLSQSFWRLFKKEHIKAPLPPNVLTTNQDKLDFLKSKKQDHHRSQKYDDSDDDDTHSVSDDGLCVNDFNRSFMIANGERTDSRKEGGPDMLAKHNSIELEDHIFNSDDFDGHSSPEKDRSPHHAQHGHTKGHTVTNFAAASEDSAEVALFAQETPRSNDTASTITMSHIDHTERDQGPPSPTNRSSAYAHSHPQQHSASMFMHSVESRDEAQGCNHVPFLAVGSQSEKVSNRRDSQHEYRDHSWEPQELQQHTRSQPGPLPRFDSPRTQDVNVPPSIHTESPAASLPVRTVNRSNSEGSSSSQKPLFTPPTVPPLPMPPRKSLRGLPPPQIQDNKQYIPARSVPRTHSESAAAIALTARSLSDDEERAAGQPSARQQPEKSSKPKKITVPIRLVKGDDVNAVLASISPPGEHHAALHSRAQSTGDLHHSSGGGNGAYDSPGTVSVKELRRNFERPVLNKENSGSSYESNEGGKMGFSSPNLISPPPAPVPVAQPNIMVKRTNSEKSYSTLSTHSYIPAGGPAHGTSTAKMLVPVRLTAQEQAYGVVSPPPPAPQPVHHHHMHRVATAPSMSVPPPAGEKATYQQDHRPPAHQHQHGLHRSASNVPYCSAPMHVSGEKYSPYEQDPYSSNNYSAPPQKAPQPHHMHRSMSMGAPVSGEKAPIGYNSHEERQYGERRYAPHTHAPRSATPVIAPPIRLQSNDYLPPPQHQKQGYQEPYRENRQRDPSPYEYRDSRESEYHQPRHAQRDARSPPRDQYRSHGQHAPPREYYEASGPYGNSSAGVASRYNGVYAN